MVRVPCVHSGGGGKLACAGRGSFEPLFQTPSPSLQGSRDGDPRRANGGGSGGGPEIPPTSVARSDPQDALIISRYVSWGECWF